MNRRRKNQYRAQGIVEYVLITAMVALATITIFKTFRADLTTAYKKAGDALIQSVEESLTGSQSSE